MAKTRQLRKRIKAVANIRRITKTMQMIATAKFSAALQRATASKPYTEALFELVTDLARNVGEVSHPLFGGSSGRRGNAPVLTLVLTSDRGLCGPYNGSVLRTAMQFLRANPAAKSGLVELVGKKGAAFLKFNNVPVAQQHQIGDKPTYEAIEAIANQYMERFASGQVGAVHVVYMRFISAGRQVPTTLQLLPFSAEAAAQLGRARSAAGAPGDDPAHATANYEFSPSPAELLGDLLPAAVKAVLFQTFNDAVVSEHVARMVAMKAATDNAGKAGKNLTRVFNRARQAQITTELTEIISGAAALN